MESTCYADRGWNIYLRSVNKHFLLMQDLCCWYLFSHSLLLTCVKTSECEKWVVLTLSSVPVMWKQDCSLQGNHTFCKIDSWRKTANHTTVNYDSKWTLPNFHYFIHTFTKQFLQSLNKPSIWIASNVPTNISNTPINTTSNIPVLFDSSITKQTKNISNWIIRK